MKLIPTTISENCITYSFQNHIGELGYSIIKLKPTIEDEELKGFENHIYYEIHPDFRGKGLGEELLELTLEQAGILGIDPIILICNNENVASQKYIELFCGLPVESKQKKDGTLFNKYTTSWTRK
jgi:predicted acetyltransferase